MNRLGYQVRASAISGIQSALQILFITVAMIPVRVIMNHVLRSEAEVEWKASLVIGASLALMWYVGVCTSTFVDIRREVAHRRQIRQSFPASAFISGIYGVALLFSAVISVGMYREGDPAWLQITPLLFVLTAFYGWPRTIHVDETSIWQRSRLGRRTTIDFAHVVSLASADGTTTVTGSTGTIQHTQYHALAQQFAALVSKRSGKEVY